eukprot:1148591-Pelagomonas_calceolata.AAC.2
MRWPISVYPSSFSDRVLWSASCPQHEVQRESILKQSIFSSSHRLDSKHNSSSAAGGGRGSSSSSKGSSQVLSRGGQLLSGRGGSGQMSSGSNGGGSSLHQRAAKLARLQGRV